MNHKVKLMLIVSPLVFIAVTVAYLVLTTQPLAASPKPQRPRITVVPPPLPTEVASDPVMRNPIFASLARIYGPDWERKMPPDSRPWLDWQRKILPHALITGFSGGDPQAMAAVPKFIITVTEWDGADLFELGLPRTIDGKPVEIMRLGFGELGYDLIWAPSLRFR